MRIISSSQFVMEVKTTLQSRPFKLSYSHFDLEPTPTERAAYVLIVGAGFSYGVVPLVDKLLNETIGDYYYPDLDQWGERPASVLRKHSADFWKEFNKSAQAAGQQTV